MKRCRGLLLVVLLVSLGPVLAEAAEGGGAIPVTGTSQRHDLVSFVRESGQRKAETAGPYLRTAVLRRAATYETMKERSAASVQDWFGLQSIPQPLVSFDGASNLDNVHASGYLNLPPDTNGDVGLNHYVQIVNDFIAIYDKRGNRLSGMSDSAFWAGFGGECETSDGRTDPVVLYDGLADRWLISQVANNGNASSYCIAISQTGDPLGKWYRYSFQGIAGKKGDYPKIGIWPDAYYMSVNQFVDSTYGDAFWGVGAVAFDRSRMLNGLDAGSIYFDLHTVNPRLYSMLPAHLSGPKAPPAGAPNYFVEFDDLPGSSDRLQIWEFHADWNTPANSSFTHKLDLNVEPFDSNMCPGTLNCIHQAGTTVRLDPISDRLMYRLQYRNFGPYRTMVVNHTVDVDGTDHAGIRWYELRESGGLWVVRQQGTYAPDANHRWMGSMAMDGDGNIALGYSVSGLTTYPSVRYTGRLANDPLNTLPQGEATLVEGSGFQADPAGRWGDYSSMSIDPVDDHTFWYTQEYYDAEGLSPFYQGRGWKTRIGSFTFRTYTITASAGPGGSIFPSGSMVVGQGTDKIFNITSLAGYHISDVLVDSVSAGPVDSYTFFKVAADHTITVGFEPDPCSATLSANLDLHVPFVSFDGAYLQGDGILEVAGDGSIYVVVTGYSPVNPGAFAGCAPAVLTADLHMSLPVVLYNGASLHANLEYSSPPDGSIRFRVLAYGQN